MFVVPAGWKHSIWLLTTMMVPSIQALLIISCSTTELTSRTGADGGRSDILGQHPSCNTPL
ncbi:hypothetical protein BDR03DRAFT_964997 [Suillus americanus]|nr:hypothetical protein BDR03DRAFT_964997 [Suillus americanus]